MSNDKHLQAYMEKMLDVQRQREESTFTQQELREIALSVGMTEADWAEAQKTLRQHTESGLAHLEIGNYVDALRELEEALKLNPTDEEALYGAAKSSHELYVSTKRDFYAKKVVDYADRVLRNENPHLDKKAVSVLQEMRRTDGEYKGLRERQRWIVAGIGAAVLIFLFVVYMLLKNSICAAYHEVERHWAQVENVCQRRADLIPKLISISQAQAEYNQQTLDKLASLRTSLNPKDAAAYAKGQEEINKLIAQLLGDLAKSTSTGSSEQAMRAQFDDLRAQIEGAENRIAVERKRFNESVANYNRQISQFPYSLLGYKEATYFKSEK